jgi:effector-binding domain-containing protein
MNIVDTQDLWVVSQSRRLTIPQVKGAATELCPQIDADLTRSGIRAQEPWIFVSYNLPKDGKTLFDWRCCRPISTPSDYDGPFELLHLEPIIVATHVHQGPMRTLFSQGYAPLVRAIEESRHTFSGESRELYHHYDGPKAGYHKIEIQFGLAY